MDKIISLSTDKFMVLLPTDSATGLIYVMDNFIGDDGALYYKGKYYQSLEEAYEAMPVHCHICKRGVQIQQNDFAYNVVTKTVYQVSEGDIEKFEINPSLLDINYRVVSSTDDQMVWDTAKDDEIRDGMYFKIISADSDLGAYGSLIKYMGGEYTEEGEVSIFRTPRRELIRRVRKIESYVREHELRALVRISYPTEDLVEFFKQEKELEIK